jgi:hypothetical protein
MHTNIRYYPSIYIACIFQSVYVLFCRVQTIPTMMQALEDKEYQV